MVHHVGFVVGIVSEKPRPAHTTFIVLPVAGSGEPKRTPGFALLVRQILALIAEGCPNKEIAARLFISNATVRTHLMHIYEKLHVHCRTEAAAKYLRANPSGPIKHTARAN
jgi:DNA-binding CsgD family transcriptional regulator